MPKGLQPAVAKDHRLDEVSVLWTAARRMLTRVKNVPFLPDKTLSRQTKPYHARPAHVLAPSLAISNRRCGTHEHVDQLALLRGTGLGVDALQVGPGGVLAYPQHLSRFPDAEPWRHGEEDT